jgi:DNA-binding NarL/FixJ family response regulator
MKLLDLTFGLCRFIRRSIVLTTMQIERSQNTDKASALDDAPLRILVADDHALFRAGLRHLLTHFAGEPHIVEAHDFEETQRRLSEADSLDLLLLDLNMPGMDGIAAVRRLCKQAPDVPIIVVSVRDNAEDVRNALDAGAMGYIPKSSTPEVMVSALQLVLSGGVYLPPNLLDGAPPQPETDATSDNDENNDLLQRLTPRQCDVLRLLAQGKSNKQIAEALGLAPGTIKIHISRILRAFEVQNRTQAVIAATAILNNEDAAG